MVSSPLRGNPGCFMTIMTLGESNISKGNPLSDTFRYIQIHSDTFRYYWFCKWGIFHCHGLDDRRLLSHWTEQNGMVSVLIYMACSSSFLIFTNDRPSKCLKTTAAFSLITCHAMWTGETCWVCQTIRQLLQEKSLEALVEPAFRIRTKEKDLVSVASNHLHAT